MKVGVLGAGAIAFASAALLAERGHEPILWSPSGRRTVKLAFGEPLRASGAISWVGPVRVAQTVQEAVSGADAVLVAVDAAGHRPVLEAASPYVRNNQAIIISAAYALSALHLSKAVKSRGLHVPIVSWSATIATAHQESLTEVNVRIVRPMMDIAVFEEGGSGRGLEVCQTLFGERFRQKESALEVALIANSNPVFHVPVTLLNVTRVEQKEGWITYERTTECVSRLVEALDAERVAIGAAYGFSIPTVNEHFHHSFGVPLGSMAAMMASLFQRGLKPKGALSVAHRHISQDIPWGLVFASKIGKMAGVFTPMHDAVIALASTALGQDFERAWTSGALIDCDRLSKADMLRLSRTGG
ncbi:MAG TPA: NAD/NADP octopine/nopaline dehydrogenase family protein [Pseudolabrys sp.]|nr:NAD/NADP octopine/nopaline dehydrogenase family protein [Pseudolabrys sp.]